MSQKKIGNDSMFENTSPSIKNTDLQEIYRIGQYGQYLRCKTQIAEVSEECDQREGKVCKTNFILVVRFVGFPSKALGFAFVKYKMTGEAEETDKPNGVYGDNIECSIKIVTEQLIIAEENTCCAYSYP